MFLSSWGPTMAICGSGPVAVIGSLSRSAGAARRIGELGQALGARAGRRLAPRLGIVEQVPVLEGEGEAGIGGEPLPDHADAALAAALQPVEHAAMDVRLVIEGLHDVHDDRPAAQGRDLLVEGLVAGIVARDQQHLHEAVVALGQHPGELAAGLVVHDVGRHRRAVMVALHRGRAGRQHALGRPAAGAGIHRLVQQAPDLGVLLGRRQLARPWPPRSPSPRSASGEIGM